MIRPPLSWRTNLDSYPGRLVFSSETPTMDGNFAFFQVSRLPLKALLRNAGATGPPNAATCGKWEELTVGGVTAATVARWMMLAQQKSISVKMGMSFQPDTEIVEASVKSGGSASSGSELTWRAKVVFPEGPNGGSVVQGSAGRTYSLTDAPEQAGPKVEPRVSYGKALIRGGTIVFVLVDAPQSRSSPDYAGPAGGQYLQAVAESLQLLEPQVG